MSLLRQIFPHYAHCVKLWRAPLDNIDQAKNYFAFLGNNKRAIELTVGVIVDHNQGRIHKTPDISLALAKYIARTGLSEGTFEAAAMNLSDFFAQNFNLQGELEVNLLEFEVRGEIGIFDSNKKGRIMRP